MTSQDLKAEDVPKLKVVELRDELKDRGLDVKGTKAVLADRLVAFLEESASKEDGASSSPVQNDPPAATTEASDAPKSPVANKASPKRSPAKKTAPIAPISPLKPAASPKSKPESKPEETAPEEIQAPSSPPSKRRKWARNDGAADTAVTEDTLKEVIPEGLAVETGKDTPAVAGTADDDAMGTKEVAEEVPTDTLHIRNFVRPFTANQLKTMLQESGAIKRFWMDNIKTHCFVTFEGGCDEASATHKRVNGLKWPLPTGKVLQSEYSTVEELEKHESGSVTTPAARKGRGSLFAAANAAAVEAKEYAKAEKAKEPKELKAKDAQEGRRDRREVERENREAERRKRRRSPSPMDVEGRVVTLDELFRKTKAEPQIYYLPLTDEEVASRKAKADSK